SNTGTTARVAEMIAAELGVSSGDIHDVAKSAPSDVAPYEVLVFGSSTWGSGDMQDDWYDFADGVQALDLKGKKIALFGCGDETMSDTFCGAVGELYDRLKCTGAEFIAPFDADCYDYSHTPAEIEGRIVGLLIDDVNHRELTAGRVARWCRDIQSQS
ncbi:MAG: flavodoxin, partial [Muribaculaceae bacterium]|nr:flavodoxin [Muribaculaceae bacterium]